MLISVVTPLYNAGKYLASTIESVRAQTISSWEMIIVDDGSKDESPQVARRYAEEDSRIRVVQQANAGVAAARNRGVSETKNSDYLLMLDQDDVLEPDALEVLTRAIQSNPGTVAAHGNARFIDGEGKLWRVGAAEWMARERRSVSNNHLVPIGRDQNTSFNTLVFINCIHTPGQVLIVRSVLNDVGPFDPQTVPCDDWDMWLRLSLRGDIAYIDHVVLNFRRHGNNESLNTKKMEAAEVALRRALFNLEGLTEEKRKIATYGFRFARRQGASYSLDLAKGRFAKRYFIDGLKYIRRALIAWMQSLGPHPS